MNTAEYFVAVRFGALDPSLVAAAGEGAVTEEVADESAGWLVPSRKKMLSGCPSLAVDRTSDNWEAPMFGHRWKQFLALPVIIGALGANDVVMAQSPAPLQRVRAVTFTGDEISKTGNASGVLLQGDRVIIADDELRGVLVGRRTAPDTYAFGPRVTFPVSLPGGAADEEFDFEALVATGDVIVAVGSHSRVRTSADSGKRTQAENRKRQLDTGPRPDRDGLFQFRLDAATPTLQGGVQAASLRSLIQTDKILGPFAALPGKENGVDIEGLAVEGQTFWAGFRGPVLRHGYAAVLRFTSSTAPKAEALMFVPLGGRGIRDLVKTPDGLLVLAGPVGDGDQSEAVYWWNGLDCMSGSDSKCQLSLLGSVPRQGEGRAEGIAIVGSSDDAYEVLVVFDGTAGGAPGVYRVPKPARR